MIGFILLGAPGSGKGTQAKRLQADLKIPHISTGDMLRQEISRGSALGLRVKDILASGKLVDDELMNKVIENRFSQDDVKAGFVLDGYPRTSAQAGSLEKVLALKKLSLPLAVQIDLPKAELSKRLLGRLSCTQCGSSFHRQLNPPRVENKCDQCGSALIQRKDDNEETVCKRLEVYEKETAVLLDYYRSRGLLKEVNGLQSMEKITEDIKRALGI
jgi:adenylate kinase